MTAEDLQKHWQQYVIVCFEEYGKDGGVDPAPTQDLLSSGPILGMATEYDACQGYYKNTGGLSFHIRGAPEDEISVHGVGPNDLCLDWSEEDEEWYRIGFFLKLQ